MAYAQCGNATQAYKDAGYNVKTDNSAAANAANLIRNHKVQERLQEIGAKIKSKRIMDAVERRELLTQFARDAEVNKADRLKAMDLLNKMDGVYITKTQVSGADGGPLSFRWEGDA